MDKAEFIERLTKQFRGIIAAAERRAKLDIEKSRTGLSETLFVKWMKSKAKAANKIVLQSWYVDETPETAAQVLAMAIYNALDGNVNWGEQWQHAYATTANPRRVTNWGFRPIFANYAKVFQAAARRRIFKQPDQAKPLRAGAPTPTTFDELFLVDEEKAAAIDVAERLGLVGRNGDGNLVWDYDYTTGAILAFFQALQDRKLIYEVKPTPGCKMIAKKFGVKPVKNYKSADFTPSLRKTIKGHLPKHRDNNGDNNGDGI